MITAVITKGYKQTYSLLKEPRGPLRRNLADAGAPSMVFPGHRDDWEKCWGYLASFYVFFLLYDVIISLF